MTGKQGKKHERHKRGLKLFFLPKPQGQKHKHKKNKYYVSHDDDSGSIMSGDSPAHHNRTAEAFDYNTNINQNDGRPYLVDSKALPSTDGRSSPVATTSKDVGVQSTVAEQKGEKQGKGEVQASVLAEPGGKDKEDDDKYFGSPTLNNSEGGSDGEKDEETRRRKNDDGGYEGRDKKDRKDDKFKKNGNIDKLDGVWVPKDKKQREDQDDDNCIVKCLYVTMTCCECSIM